MKEKNNIKTFIKKEDNKIKSLKDKKINLYSIFCHIVHGVILVSWSYSIMIVIMANVIPAFSAYFAHNMGISYDSEILDILGLWMLPCIFFVLILFYFAIFSIKGLHKWLKKNFEKSVHKHNLQKQTERKNKIK